MSQRLSFNPITQTPTPVGASPSPLQDWCRTSVIATVGLANLDKVQSLPLPGRMKEAIVGLTLADFYINGETLPAECHDTRVYPATCLPTNTPVNLRVLTTAEDIDKENPSFLCCFEEDSHWIVVEEPTQTLNDLIQACKAEGKVFNEAILWQALEALIDNIIENGVSPTSHISTECISFSKGRVIVKVGEGSAGMDVGPGAGINAVYEAPEVLSNNHPNSLALVWSIGCIIYEALALEPAFYDSTGTNPFSVYMDVTNGIIPEMPSGGSEELQDLLRKCLVHDRETRLPFEDLRSIVNNHEYE